MSTKKRKLKMNINFEPNRLADTHLSDAYEQLLPFLKRTRQMRSKTLNEKAKQNLVKFHTLTKGDNQ